VQKAAPNRYSSGFRAFGMPAHFFFLDLGKATIGYRNYALLEKNGFINKPLVPPDPPRNMSKRQFDKEIREWRRKLHAYDNVEFFDYEEYTNFNNETEDDRVHMFLGSDLAKEIVQPERKRKIRFHGNEKPCNFLCPTCEEMKQKVQELETLVRLLMDE